MSIADKRLEDMGLELATPRQVSIPFLRVACDEGLVYVSGHTPSRAGKLLYAGKVGEDLTVEQGYEAAQLACLNCLGSVKACIDDLDRVERVVKVLGFIQSAKGFHEQTRVMHGCSDLLVELFGTKGRHARSAIGVSCLPGNASVEVEMILRIRE